MGNVLGHPNVSYSAPAHEQNHVVPDADNQRVDVLTQTHRADTALSARVPVGFGVHSLGEKTQVGFFFSFGSRFELANSIFIQHRQSHAGWSINTKRLARSPTCWSTSRQENGYSVTRTYWVYGRN